MLILGRRFGESIMINDDIKITILQPVNNGKAVRIGIDAPREISVHREEIWDKIQLEKQMQEPHKNTEYERS